MSKLSLLWSPLEKCITNKGFGTKVTLQIGRLGDCFVEKYCLLKDYEVSGMVNYSTFKDSSPCPLRSQQGQGGFTSMILYGKFYLEYNWIHQTKLPFSTKILSQHGKVFLQRSEQIKKWFRQNFPQGTDKTNTKHLGFNHHSILVTDRYFCEPYQN